MKAKTFELERGEYAVVAEYSNFNDAAESEELTTIRTHERPRPRMYTDIATLALRAREYYGLGELPLRVIKLAFSENDDGRFCRLTLEDQTNYMRIMPTRLNRKPDTKPGDDEPDPESKKNILLAAVDLVENRISEYLAGDREQPDLPVHEEPEVKQGGLFGVLGKGRKQRASATT